MKTIKHNYLVISILSIIFMLPGLLAYEFFIHPNWLSQSKVNKGQLLEPEKLSISPLKHKWRLILWYPNHCEADCLKKIDRLARIRLALGRHLYEVENLILLKEGELTSGLRKRFDENDINVSSLPLSQTKSRYLMSDPQIFIANPRSYLILAYNINAKSEDIFHDIQQLIRNSREKVST